MTAVIASADLHRKALLASGMLVTAVLFIGWWCEQDFGRRAAQVAGPSKVRIAVMLFCICYILVAVCCGGLVAKFVYFSSGITQ
jgi:hypothetical protein